MPKSPKYAEVVLKEPWMYHWKKERGKRMLSDEVRKAREKMRMGRENRTRPGLLACDLPVQKHV